MQTQSTIDLQQFIRSNGIASGGYQMALMMLDGSVLDVQAAREHYRLIRRETGRGWTAVTPFIHYWVGDDPLICAHSGREIDGLLTLRARVNGQSCQNL